MKINHLPTFEITLPITKQKVAFRPFVMKEEKLLLLASESGDRDSILRALNESVKSCTFDTVSCETHPMVDVQKLFLEIRGKSVGEIIEFNLVCGNCKKTLPSSLNISEVEVKFYPGHTSRIELTPELIVTMRYPKLEHLALLTNPDASLDDIYNVVGNCIESIQTAEEAYTRENTPEKDFREFVDNITTSQFSMIKEFFDTMPAIHHDIRFVCSGCDRNNIVNVNEVVNFFV
jgi:hypothetical protein